MDFNNKRKLIFRLIVSILSLISSVLIFINWHLQVINDRKVGGNPEGYSLVILFGILFLFSAVLYWFSKPKWLKIIQNILLVINLVFTLSSILSVSPVDFALNSSGIDICENIVLVLALILGFIYLNIAALTTPKKILLFCLKSFATLAAVGVTFYLSLMITTGGNTFLMMDLTTRNWALFGMLIWMLLNLAYGILIWFKAFRSWWSWLFSIIVMIEILVPFVSAVVAGEEWYEIIFALIACGLIVWMNYLNNQMNK